MTELTLSLLGPFRATLGAKTLDSFRSNKTQALLAYLVTEVAFAGERRPPAHRRQRLMALLWPRTPQKSAQVNLRQTLYQLRQAIPEVAGSGGNPVPFLVSDRQTVHVNPAAKYRLDVARFLLSGALLARDPSPDDLAEAQALYRGPFLSDFHLPDSETFEEWAAARRATLHRMALEALETLTVYHLERTEPEAAERYARRQLALDELRESGHRHLLRALVQKGERNTALAHYDAYRTLLARELGVEPSPAMETVYEAVRAGEGVPAATPAARQVAEARTKPRLPSPATPFVGRRREIAEITGMFEDGCRLLTLLGPGGSGKSRLALEVARRRADQYARGCAFVDLAPLSDPAAIPAAIATALDFRFTAEGTPREQILNYLANKELLLVLDNVEHLLDMHLLDSHQPDGAELVDELLQAAPDVSVLATSRARLHLGAEYMYEVSGLSVKEDGLQEAESDAAEMFIEHARRVQPGFAPEKADRAVVARICRLVEGMPLAIELAASWVRYIPPAGIAQELAEDLNFLESERADLPERQRSMQATFDHSWQLIGEGERQALMKLSVFRGGAGRRAAKAVTGASLRGLTALADRALLTLDPASGRFALHELIRQFAEERLEEAGAAGAVRDAHSAYYLHALAARLPDLKGRDQLGALDAIEDDFENVRAAWLWAIRQERWQHFPEAGQSLFLFALFRDRHHDGVDLFDSASCAIPSSATTVAESLTRAYTLASGHALLSRLGSHEKALAAVPALQTTVERLDDPAAIAYCRLMIGQILNYDVMWGENPAEAIATLNAADAYYQQAQDPFYRLIVLWWLGYAYSRARKIEKGIAVVRRALALARETGDLIVAAALLHNLGAVTWDQEGPTEAVEYYFREATDLHRQIGARANYGNSLSHVGFLLLWREGDLTKTQPILEEALAVAVEQNEPYNHAHRLTLLATHRLLAGEYDRVLALTDEALSLVEKNVWSWCWTTFQRGIAFFALGDLDAALPFLKRGLSRLNELSYHGWLVNSLAYSGALMARQGEHQWAVELLALGLTENHHRAGLEIDPLLTRTRAELEAELGEEAFAAAWERGKDLDPLAAAAEVLEMLESLLPPA